MAVGRNETVGFIEIEGARVGLKVVGRRVGRKEIVGFSVDMKPVG